MFACGGKVIFLLSKYWGMKKGLLAAVLILVVFSFSPSANGQQGVLDVGFGNGGKVITPSPMPNLSGMEGNSIALQQDGKIIVAGRTLSIADSSKFVVFRYNTDGSPDNSFGTNGVVITAVNQYGSAGAHAVAVQVDGKIIVGGYAIADSFSRISPALVRYNSNGSVDSSFGLNGTLYINTSNWFDPNIIYKIVVLPNGKIDSFLQRKRLTINRLIRWLQPRWRRSQSRIHGRYRTRL